MQEEAGTFDAPLGETPAQIIASRRDRTKRGHAVINTLERWGRMRAFGPLIGTLVLIVIFRSMNPLFFSAQEISGFTALGSSIGIVAIGAGFLMISGEFDLSVASVFALSQVVFGKLLSSVGLNPLLALVVVLVMAAGVGLVNGFITTRFTIPSFITTLASFLMVGGINLVITQGNTILYFGRGVVKQALGGSINQYISAPLLWWIGLAACGWFTLERTRYGNWSRAAGGRSGTAFAMGVPARRVKMTNFALCSILAALSACAQFASYGAASASNGQDYELYAIVAAVIGGTSLFGVVGSMTGIFLGGLILGILQTGLVLVGVPGEWYTPVIGAILVCAAILNVKLSGFNLARLRAKLLGGTVLPGPGGM